MEDKLFDKLEQLDIEETNLLLSEEIKLPLNGLTRKRIEQKIIKKAGYYPENNTLRDKINNIIGGIIMKRKMALALSGALLLSLGGGGYAYAKTTPVAYVSLDINPSIELGVNTFDQVVSAEAYNEDGQKVLEGIALINSDINKAVDKVISSAISEGYVKEDGSSGIEITTSSDKENVANKIDETAKEAANEALDDNNVNATVETEKVALERRDEARKLGITPGKLNLIQKLQELDPTISVDDYKSSSVKEIMKKTKELRKANKQDQDNTTVDQDNTNTSTSNSTTTTTDQTQAADQQTSAQTSTDSTTTVTTQEEKNKGYSNAKHTTGKVEDDQDEVKEEKDSKGIVEKKNNENANSQNNSSKSEHSNNGKSEGKGNK